MEINKPKFWDKKRNIISIFLIPLSWIYLFIIFLKEKFTIVRKFKIPIICIGNIYIGGTGKTPAAILLANEIKKDGKQPVILRRHYYNHKDEYEMIKNNFQNCTYRNLSGGIVSIHSGWKV